MRETLMTLVNHGEYGEAPLPSNNLVLNILRQFPGELHSSVNMGNCRNLMYDLYI